VHTSGVSALSHASSPAGISSNKKTFTLPHGLGTLPASESALAKTDRAYAAGLLNPVDWVDIHSTGHTQPFQDGWFYVGGATGSSIGPIINAKIIAASIRSAANNIATSKQSIEASQLNTFPANDAHFFQSINGKGYSLVTPDVLAIRAAPTGTLTVHGAPLGAICVPSPEAVLKGGHVVTLKGIPTITAGPSTIFAFKSSSSSPGAPTLYDQGTTSCFSFH